MMDPSAQLEFYGERLAPIPESRDAPALADAETLARQCHFSAQDGAPGHEDPMPGIPGAPPGATTILEPTRGLVLRRYQSEAVDAVLASLARGEHPAVRLPTGSGKSLVLAALCRHLQGRILCVTHRKKLLEQSAATLTSLLGIGEDIGIYSAGLQQRDTTQRVLFGGVASIYKRMDILQEKGSFSHIIIDELHMVSPLADRDSMYSTVLTACPEAQRIGLSATPSRLGVPCWGEGQWFSHLVVDTGIEALTPEYLAPLTSVWSARDIDLSHVRIQKGEFVQADASQIMSEEIAAARALDEVCALAAQRRSWALFCCDIAHTKLVASLLRERGVSCGALTSDQASAENDMALDDFAQGRTRALASCIMMTTGFDIPGIDCITLLRPTMSKELLIQMIGRGTRLTWAKEDCLILDYAGNLERHAPLGEIASTSRTAERLERDALQREEQERKERERRAKHSATVFQEEAQTYRVARVAYRLSFSAKQPGRKLVEVAYHCPARGEKPWVKAWLCVEYRGYPRQVAEAFFSRRSLACPASAREALGMLQRTRPPRAIVVRKDGWWDRVLCEYWDENPEEKNLLTW